MAASAAASASAAAEPRRPLQMPVIMYGTAWKGDRTADLVAQALTVGFSGIDTACQPKHYNEAGVGEGIRRWVEAGAASKSPLAAERKREQIFLQTKFTPLSGQDLTKPLPYDQKAPLATQVEQSFATSQKNLQTDFIDSLVLHSPLRSVDDTLTVWGAMEKLVDEGKVGMIGISNCPDPALLRTLYDAARIKPRVVQNRFHAPTGYDMTIRYICRERQIRYQSFWTLSANPHFLDSELIMDLAKKYNRTPATIFFRALIQLGITPLTGTTKKKHMEDSLTVTQFELTFDEVEEMEQLLAMVQPADE